MRVDEEPISRESKKVYAVLKFMIRHRQKVNGDFFPEGWQFGRV